MVRTILLTSALFLLPGAVLAGVISYEAEIWCEDGVVDMDDLKRVTKNSGPCPANGECLEDLTRNGHVGRFDSMVVIGHWGACQCAGDFDNDGDRDAADLSVLEDELLDPPDCRPDVDRNGKVEFLDVHIATETWESDPDWDPRVDVNESGAITPADVLIIFDAVGRNCEADLNSDGDVDQADVDFLTDLIGTSCP